MQYKLGVLLKACNSKEKKGKVQFSMRKKTVDLCNPIGFYACVNSYERKLERKRARYS
jgi:hypothetical protein